MKTVRPMRRSREIAQELSESIRRGELPVGQALTPARELAGQFGVSINTMQLALRELETRKLIQCAPRRGSIVISRDGLEESTPISRRLVGLVGGIIQSTDHWFAQILRHMEQVLFDRRLALTPLPNELDAKGRFSQLIQRLDGLGEDLGGAICFSAPPRTERVIEELRSRNLPYVTINRPTESTRHNFVSPDNLAAACLLGEAMARQGYRRLAVLTPVLSQSISASEKVAGLYQGYLKAGVLDPQIQILALTHPSMYSVEYREAAGYQAMRRHLAEGGRPEVVYAAGDLLAIGAARALEEAGMKIPDDVGMVGTTNLPVTSEHCPPLTVIAQPMAAMGAMAGELLGQMIREGTSTVNGQWIPCEIIFRQSIHISQEIQADVLRRCAQAHPGAQPVDSLTPFSGEL